MTGGLVHIAVYQRASVVTYFSSLCGGNQVSKPWPRWRRAGLIASARNRPFRAQLIPRRASSDSAMAAPLGTCEWSKQFASARRQSRGACCGAGCRKRQKLRPQRGDSKPDLRGFGFVRTTTTKHFSRSITFRSISQLRVLSAPGGIPQAGNVMSSLPRIAGALPDYAGHWSIVTSSNSVPEQPEAPSLFDLVRRQNVPLACTQSAGCGREDATFSRPFSPPFALRFCAAKMMPAAPLRA